MVPEPWEVLVSSVLAQDEGAQFMFQLPLQAAVGDEPYRFSESCSHFHQNGSQVRALGIMSRAVLKQYC